MHLAVEIMALLIGGVLVVLPGQALGKRLWPDGEPGQRLALGVTLHLGTGVVLVFSGSFVRLGLGMALWAAAVLAVWRPWRRDAWRLPGVDTPLVVLLAAIGLARLAPLAANDLPHGWDPTFHLLLARRIAETGRIIHDWMPFMDVQLNYPLGLHVLLAAGTTLTHLPLPRLFMLAQVGVSVLAAAQVYVLARQALGRREDALAATFVYGFLTWYGSLGYLEWGGLPNQLAMSLFMGNLILLAGGRTGWRETMVFAVLHAATCIVHNHVMVAAGLVYLGLFARAWRRQERGRCRLLAAGLVLSVVVGALHIVPYALKVGDLTHTVVLRSPVPELGPLKMWRELGFVFVPLALAGLFRWRRAGTDAGAIARLATGILLGAFVVFNYGWRLWTWWRTGEATVAFAPSRFLSDSTILLAIPAGLALASLRRRLHLRPRVAIGAAVLLAATMVPDWRTLLIVRVQPDTVRAYQWIDAHTVPEAIIVTTDPWAPYCAWRRTMATPTAYSEAPPPADDHTRRVADLLSGLRPWPMHPPLLVVDRPERLALPHRVLWAVPNSRLAVLEVLPPE